MLPELLLESVDPKRNRRHLNSNPSMNKENLTLNISRIYSIKDLFRFEIILRLNYFKDFGRITWSFWLFRVTLRSFLSFMNCCHVIFLERNEIKLCESKIFDSKWIKTSTKTIGKLYWNKMIGWFQLTIEWPNPVLLNGSILFEDFITFSVFV